MRQRQHPYGGRARLSLVTPLTTVHAHTHTSHHILCVRGPQAAVFVPQRVWQELSCVIQTRRAAQRNIPTHIRWINDLKDASGAYLPHILRDSIDQTIHWANPAVSVRIWSRAHCLQCCTTRVHVCEECGACERQRGVLCGVVPCCGWVDRCYCGCSIRPTYCRATAWCACHAEVCQRW